MRLRLIVSFLTLICVAQVHRSPAVGSVLANPGDQHRGTLEQALQAAATSLGFVYAGECSTARSPEDLGRLCTTFVEERSRIRAYIAGRTFSEYTLWLFIAEGPDGWRPAGDAPFDFFAPTLTPPWPVGP
jgi:hypothetical protein